METLHLIYNFIIIEIQKAPFAITIAFLAFLVSFLSALNSSITIRLTKKRDKESNLLISAEKKTSLLTILQDAHLSAINAKKAITLTDYSVGKISNYLSSATNEKLIERVNETRKKYSSIKEKIEIIEQQIKDKYVEVENMKEINKPYIFEKISPGIKALQKEAQEHLERALSLYKEIDKYHDLILKKLLGSKRKEL